MDINDFDKLDDDMILELKNKFPMIFSHLDYIECHAGWKNLITSLCYMINSEIKRLPPELGEAIYAVQIKQKFGGLRFYMSCTTPRIDGAISMAEQMSGCVCEYCGNVAKPRNINGWMTTLCDQHYAEESKHTT